MSGFEGGSGFPRFRLSADLLTSPRTLFAMAAAGRLPRQLAAVNRRFGSPAVAIVMHTATAAALAIKADFNTLTTLASSALLLIYFMSAVRLIVLQRRKIGEDRVVFRLPGGPVIPLAATILVLGLIRALAWHEIVALLVAVAFAGITYVLSRLRRVPEPASNVPI